MYRQLRTACAQCIRSSKSGRSSISARMRAYASTTTSSRNENNDVADATSNYYLSSSTTNRGMKIIIVMSIFCLLGILLCFVTSTLIHLGVKQQVRAM